MATRNDRSEDRDAHDGVADASSSGRPAQGREEAGANDSEAGLAREVGDLEDADAESQDGALPGRAGGGLAGG